LRLGSRALALSLRSDVQLVIYLNNFSQVDSLGGGDRS
jgi:hypothetical protein